jgi:protein TonB
VIDQPQVVIPIPSQIDAPPIDDTPVIVPNTGPVIGPGKDPVIVDVKPLPKPLPVRTGPRFATPESQLRPPYPANKIESDEEAALRLRLSIDERGRVTAVEPVGSADPSFLAAARRHLIARWRYQPATEDGRPVPSTTVITLRFELD